MYADAEGGVGEAAYLGTRDVSVHFYLPTFGFHPNSEAVTVKRHLSGAETPLIRNVPRPSDHIGGTFLARTPLASSSFFFSAAQYSASDGSLSKSGLYLFSSYFDRGIGMLPVP